MSDLLEFLRARLDEDEGAAAPQHPDLLWGETAADNDRDERRARALREVEAGRRILARYEDCVARMEDPDYPAGVARDQAREYEDFVLPNLVAKYDSHPDYRQEWKP